MLKLKKTFKYYFYRKMSETCLIVKYCGTFGKGKGFIKKYFILDKNYTKKFKKHPIENFESLCPTDSGDCTYVILKQYFIKTISKKNYNFIKELELTDDAIELFEILDEN